MEKLTTRPSPNASSDTTLAPASKDIRLAFPAVAKSGLSVSGNRASASRLRTMSSEVYITHMVGPTPLANGLDWPTVVRSREPGAAAFVRAHRVVESPPLTTTRMPSCQVTVLPPSRRQG
ncbi:MAG: hypothetical protein LH630_09820 [Actinomycetia bacterium]|nr:hypothetical protein [Actinomycetes bacterium]